jgi:hypothetical protein
MPLPERERVDEPPRERPPLLPPLLRLDEPRDPPDLPLLLPAIAKLLNCERPVRSSLARSRANTR